MWLPIGNSEQQINSNLDREFRSMNANNNGGDRKLDMNQCRYRSERRDNNLRADHEGRENSARSRN